MPPALRTVTIAPLCSPNEPMQLARLGSPSQGWGRKSPFSHAEGRRSKENTSTRSSTGFGRSRLIIEVTGQPHPTNSFANEGRAFGYQCRRDAV
jgi:hypothetical protein